MMNTAEKENYLPELPEELIVNIIKRLPVKPLLQCMCVSRSWNSMITSSCFINGHLDRAEPLLITHLVQAPEFFPHPMQPPKLVSHPIQPLIELASHPIQTPIELFSLHQDSESLDIQLEFEIPCDCEGDSDFNIIGCCNGIICVSHKYLGRVYRLVLCNPSIRKTLNLEPLEDRQCNIMLVTLFGFGYDSQRDDYRIVAIETTEQPTIERDKVLVDCKVYSLNERSWNPIDFNLSISYFRPKLMALWGSWYGNALLNGVLYWLVDDGVDNFVLSFDLSNDSFGDIRFPACLAGCKERMALLTSDNSIMVYLYDSSDKSFEMWILKESWTKQFRSEAESIGLPMVIRKNRDILMTKFPYGEEVVSWNRRQGIQKLQNLEGKQRDYIDYFVESLALIHKSKETKTGGGDKRAQSQKPNLTTRTNR